jgi:hypothetical protein
LYVYQAGYQWSEKWKGHPSGESIDWKKSGTRKDLIAWTGTILSTHDLSVALKKVYDFFQIYPFMELIIELYTEIHWNSLINKQNLFSSY